jgi:hypothetical protein
VKVKGKTGALEREQRNRAWLAWHAGLIGRMKTPPALADLMGIEARAKRGNVEEAKSVFAAIREAAEA